MAETRTECVMLAAGESSRMKDWKMMLPFMGSTIIEKSVENALKVSSRVILVTGYRSAELKKNFSLKKSVEIVENTQFEKGMFSSIKLGTAQVTGDRFYIALGDMPLVDAAVYRIMLGYTCAPVIIPKYQGKKGHPVLLSREVAESIMKTPETKTLRDVLALFPTLAVPVQTARILKDIDSAEDYEHLAGGNR